MPDAKEQTDDRLPRTPCSAWVACSERIPADFQMVLMQGRDLGYFVGSLRDGRWRVYTPLNAADGRRIMVEDLPSPEHWMQIPSLPNATAQLPPRSGPNSKQDASGG